MGNNGGILKVKQIGKNLVSGLIIVNMLKKKKKKGHCEDLIPFNTSGIFCISDSRSELHMQKREPKMQMNMDKSVNG